ncbi:heterokaryon incompatibility protein-domain-containing protein [Aspergillus ambiguus]|uniref:HET domain-containing protein n=1 Tax=Aspergillus ambiguus TaxID=176160 RepID=UPI003CCDAF59
MMALLYIVFFLGVAVCLGLRAVSWARSIGLFLPLPTRVSTTMPLFTYRSLPPEPNATRMIHLLPSHDKNAPIKCKLFDYNLAEARGGQHLYDALSYVWGSEVKSHSITLNGSIFPVTENLHTALLHLRDKRLKRVLWVDAISINQDNTDEKHRQIPLMRTIYALAEHVIVWLGDAEEDGEQALDTFRSLGRGSKISSSMDTSEENHDACLSLLQRDWFRRIWVLQEVGVARSTYITCGSVQINGHVFCEGLRKLKLSSSFLAMVGPAISLIDDALYRPKYELGSRGDFSIGELLGMYCNHRATKQHDKVYALLGLSADPITTALEPNYDLPWDVVFKQVTQYIFPGCSVETWLDTEVAVIRGKGWILGYITSVEGRRSQYGQQTVKVLFSDTCRSRGYQDKWKTDWILQASGELIQDGDVVCHVQGASKPSIIRVCKDHFKIITPTVTPQESSYQEFLDGPSRKRFSTDGICDICLTWRIPHDRVGHQGQPRFTSELIGAVPHYREERSETKNRLDHLALVKVDMAVSILKLESPEHRLLEQLLRSGGAAPPRAQRLVKAASVNCIYSANKLLETLLQHREKRLISEELVIAVAESDGSYGCIIMEVLLQHRGENLPVTEEVVKAAARNFSTYGYETMEVLFYHRGDSLPVTEEVAKAAAANSSAYQHIIMEVLLRHRGESLPITEAVIKAAAGNPQHGSQRMSLLFKYYGEGLPITEGVVKTAAGNPTHGAKIMELLFKYNGGSLPVTESVVKAAAGNTSSYQHVMEVLLQHRESLLVTEEVAKVAAGNHGSHECIRSYKVMELLFHHRGKSLPITEDVVQAAAGNPEHGSSTMKLLFENFRESLPVTEEVVKAAAGNPGLHETEIMELLFAYNGESLPVTDQVVKAAAGNPGLHGHIIMEILFQYRGESLPVTDEVVKTAAGNPTRGAEIIELLFKHKGESLLITKEIVKTAAGNTSSDKHVIEVLFRYRGESLPITEEVVKMAVENPGIFGSRILDILFRHRGQSLPVTEEVVKVAAEKTESYTEWDGPDDRYDYRVGYDLMVVLFRHRGKSLPVTEEVVKAAAGNTGSYGSEIMELLFEHYGANLPVSKEVAKVAAGNPRHGAKIIKLLFRHYEKSLLVNKEVVQAAAENPLHGDEIMELLFERCGENLPVTEEVIKAAAGNPGSYGYIIMEVLFQHRGESLPVTEEVIKAAAENPGLYGYKVLDVLFRHRGQSLPEGKVRADAGNTGSKITKILLQGRGESVST